MHPKSTSSTALWSTKVSASSPPMHHSNSQHSRKAFSNSELVSDLPDLSHLSEQEREIIEAVLQRQKAEEEKDLKLTRLATKSNTNQNFSTLTSSNNSLSHVDQIKLKKPQRHSISDIAQESKQRYGSVDTGNVCDICKKIKFTNSSVGRVCFSCKSRCCIRCSVKYITKTKEIWMCSDCKKKQDELLQTTLLKRKKNPTEVMPANETGHVNPTSSKRQLPNLSRIKQLSQDESSSLAYEQSPLNTTNSLPRKSGRLKMTLVKQASLTNPPSYFKEPTEPSFLPNSTSNKHASTQELNKHLSSDNFYSSPGSSISMISRSKAERIADPTLLYKVSRSSSQKNSSSNLSELAQVDLDESSMYQREKSLNALLKEKEMQQQEVSIKATKLQHGTSLADKTLEEIQTKLEELKVSGENSSLDKPTKARKQPVLPALPVDTNTIKHRLLAELKQRSINLSDDENQSDDVELADIESNAVNNRNEELDDDEEDENEEYDLDEELRSTTEYTTNDEMEFESASLAAKKHRHSFMVNNCLVQDLPKEEILAHKINKFLSPSDWKLSIDGKKMIGHVVLKKSMIINTNSVVNSSSNSTIDSATDFNLSLSFGMKVIGGRPDPITHQLSAYIVKLKKDSIADSIGRLQVNDEIVKWNGKLLRGLSFDEVYSIINKSKQEAQIDLIVERRLKSLQVRVKNRIPVITVTSTSTPSLSKWDQDMHMYHTPVHSEPRRVRNALVRAKKPKESVINFEGSFIICQSIGSASSFIRTPNMQLFNVDLKTPSSVGRNQEGLLLGKKNFKSVSFLSNPSTPIVGNGCRGRNLLSAEHHRMRPSYSYSSIPYIDQEELDRIMKTEYNVHVINLCRIDDQDDCGFDEKPCHSCIGSLLFIFKSITSSLREYLVPLASREKNI